jgi:hypothetical protein
VGGADAVPTPLPAGAPTGALLPPAVALPCLLFAVPARADIRAAVARLPPSPRPSTSAETASEASRSPSPSVRLCLAKALVGKCGSRMDGLLLVEATGAGTQTSPRDRHALHAATPRSRSQRRRTLRHDAHAPTLTAPGLALYSYAPLSRLGPSIRHSATLRIRSLPSLSLDATLFAVPPSAAPPSVSRGTGTTSLTCADDTRTR